jgi:hypothetical protein
VVKTFKPFCAFLAALHLFSLMAAFSWALLLSLQVCRLMAMVRTLATKWKLFVSTYIFNTYTYIYVHI